MMGQGNAGAGASSIVALHGGPVIFQCYGPDGTLKWEVIEPDNMVVAAGINSMLDVLFAGSANVVDPGYVGLVGTGGTIASGTTMASHAGWTELTGYTAATRATYVDARSTHTVTNSASAATFEINTAQSIMGAFLASTSNKGGSTGTLLCAVAFTGGDRAASDGDTLNVTYTFTAADS